MLGVVVAGLPGSVPPPPPYIRSSSSPQRGAPSSRESRGRRRPRVAFASRHFPDIGAGTVPAGGGAPRCGSGFPERLGPRRPPVAGRLRRRRRRLTQLGFWNLLHGRAIQTAILPQIWITDMKRKVERCVQHHKRKKEERERRGSENAAEAGPPQFLPLRRLVLQHPHLQVLLRGPLLHTAEAAQVVEILPNQNQRKEKGKKQNKKTEYDLHSNELTCDNLSWRCHVKVCWSFSCFGDGPMNSISREMHVSIVG
ncbi:uncharacterized protein LOC117044653 [Lacerta agilis]|uniref:uncharacterized protein LOC117044653 n=1 Tax=Lacerta agilis TaxID=80427 RepID=UPI0014194EF9|nr:uncharacterized protein LOC117044653 [Lacerta agilis]